MMLRRLLTVFALAGTLGAAEIPKMFATRVEIPERGEVPGYLCVLGTNKFSFISPPGWKPEAQLERREVIFISPDLDASLTLKLSETGKVSTSAETLDRIAQLFPNAKIVEKFHCYAANQRGRACVLEQATAAGKTKVKIR